jgi:NAD(P)H-dependent flavin oxidoreductase YrpB (nitropropane dioxygenase family)
MITTKFTELLGCSVPIQQAAIGDLAAPSLAAAVAEAGGLGMVCMYDLSPAVIEKVLGNLREQTSGVFGANFIMHFMDPAMVQECVATAAAKANVIEFFYSDPDAKLIDIVHDGGALACWQVGSRAEAIAAVDAGCDFIIVQGIEAGGHVRGRISLLALLNEVLDLVEVPVLAAGGIGTGRDMAAVLAAGASGVRMGTRFVCAEEAEAHPQYVESLIAAEAKDTVYTEAFSNGWPNAPHRVLRKSVKAAEAFQGEIVGHVKPLYGDSPQPLRRFQPHTITKRVTGAIEAMPHWAGESVNGVKGLQPAKEIIQEVVDDCEKYLQLWCC